MAVRANPIMASACARIALSVSLKVPGSGSTPPRRFALKIEGADVFTDRLLHFLAPVEQEAMGIDALLHRNDCRHQKSRPVHRVKADDVLADDMHIGRPVVPVRIALVRKADAGDVVGQGIDPNIHDVLGGARYLDAPIERGSRNRQIPQAAFDEADDFVLARVGTDEIRLALVQRQELVLVGGQFEEIALLLYPLDRGTLWSAPDLVLADN